MGWSVRSDTERTSPFVLRRWNIVGDDQRLKESARVGSARVRHSAVAHLQSAKRLHVLAPKCSPDAIVPFHVGPVHFERRIVADRHRRLLEPARQYV